MGPRWDGNWSMKKNLKIKKVSENLEKFGKKI
jgi:hypothetical protein